MAYIEYKHTLCNPFLLASYFCTGMCFDFLILLAHAIFPTRTQGISIYVCSRMNSLCMQSVTITVTKRNDLYDQQQLVREGVASLGRHTITEPRRRKKVRNKKFNSYARHVRRANRNSGAGVAVRE